MTFQKTLRFASMTAASLLMLSSVSAQTILKIGYTPAATSHYGVGSTVLCDEIEKGTQGRYKCQQFPSGALGGEREMIEAVQLGTLDIVNTSTGPVGNFVPEVKIVDIPFLFRDYDHARKYFDGPQGQEMLSKFPAKGLVALAWTENGFRHMTNSARWKTKCTWMATARLAFNPHRWHFLKCLALCNKAPSMVKKIRFP
jgi:TRAP-type C4-dicarboxylate transport system substrate-binding protein